MKAGQPDFKMLVHEDMLQMHCLNLRNPTAPSRKELVNAAALISERKMPKREA